PVQGRALPRRGGERLRSSDRPARAGRGGGASAGDRAVADDRVHRGDVRPPPPLLPADAARGAAVPPETSGGTGASRPHRRGARRVARPGGAVRCLPESGPRPGALDGHRPRVGHGAQPRGGDAGGGARPARGGPLPPRNPPAPRGSALMAFVRRYRVSLVLL